MSSNHFDIKHQVFHDNSTFLRIGNDTDTGTDTILPQKSENHLEAQPTLDRSEVQRNVAEARSHNMDALYKLLITLLLSLVLVGAGYLLLTQSMTVRELLEPILGGLPG